MAEFLLVCEGGEQFICPANEELRATLLRAAPGDLNMQNANGRIAVQLPTAKTGTAIDLINFFRSKVLPEDDPERLKALYLLSASLQLVSLRDAIEEAIAKQQEELQGGPKVGLSQQEYLSGKWKERYERPEEVDKAVLLVSSSSSTSSAAASFLATGSLAGDFEERRRRRELAASLTALPDPFGIRVAAKELRLASASASSSSLASPSFTPAAGGRGAGANAADDSSASVAAASTTTSA